MYTSLLLFRFLKIRIIQIFSWNLEKFRLPESNFLFVFFFAFNLNLVKDFDLEIQANSDCILCVQIFFCDIHFDFVSDHCRRSAYSADCRLIISTCVIMWYHSLLNIPIIPSWLLLLIYWEWFSRGTGTSALRLELFGNSKQYSWWSAYRIIHITPPPPSRFQCAWVFFSAFFRRPQCTCHSTLIFLFYTKTFLQYSPWWGRISESLILRLMSFAIRDGLEWKDKKKKKKKKNNPSFSVWSSLSSQNGFLDQRQSQQICSYDGEWN